MNRFDVRAKFYEVIHSKMVHVPLTPENVKESIYNTIMLNYGAFTDGIDDLVLERIKSDPNMPPPHRAGSGTVDEAMSIIEVVINEELHFLSEYISGKLKKILSSDFGGLAFKYAARDYKHFSHLRDTEPDNFTEDGDVNYEEVAYEFIAAEKLDSFKVDGIDISIIQTPTMKSKFARFNLAGIDFILIRENKNGDGSFLSLIES